MNIFLADKTGYLSERGDLSFYTNYVTLNTTEGIFAIAHNFQKASGRDEPIKKLWNLGITANIANTMAAAFLDKKSENELGIVVSHRWLGKVTTHVADCAPSSKGPGDKKVMDELRSFILHSLEPGLLAKDADLKHALVAMLSKEAPMPPLQYSDSLIRARFYEDLIAEYMELFSAQQAETLTKTNQFRLITTHWTSITANIPLVFPTYTIAPNFIKGFAEKHPYPASVALSHTRLWERSKSGRFFFTVTGSLAYNNSKLANALEKINLTAYKTRGGTDTVGLERLKNNKAYIGNYETFLTPALKGRLVYFPPGSHIGISAMAEQHFGSYQVLNARLGIPVILINRKKLPALNAEFYVSFFDWSNKTIAENNTGSKTAIGVGLGIPFSRLMY